MSCRACGRPLTSEWDPTGGCRTPGCPLRGLLFTPVRAPWR
jgi:hypothetical protein